MYGWQRLVPVLRVREKKGVSATLALGAAPLLQLQPDQEAVGQHHGDRVPMDARPQPARGYADQPVGLSELEP